MSATVSDSRDEEFAASAGWLNRFLRRNNVTCRRLLFVFVFLLSWAQTIVTPLVLMTFFFLSHAAKKFVAHA